MICPEYDRLSHDEKIMFIGSLQHAAQSDNHMFILCKEVIHLAKLKGLFDDVVINPTGKEPNINDIS